MSNEERTALLVRSQFLQAQMCYAIDPARRAVFRAELDRVMRQLTIGGLR